MLEALHTPYQLLHILILIQDGSGHLSQKVALLSMLLVIVVGAAQAQSGSAGPGDEAMSSPSSDPVRRSCLLAFYDVS